MAKQKSNGKVGVPAFQKTAVPCLYRYSSSGVYYALLKNEGKQIRASLRTINFVEAKRKLAEFRADIGRVDVSKGQMSLHSLIQKYQGTLGKEAEKTLRRKNDIADRFTRDFPKGKNYPINKITPSDLLAWLAKYEFGPASRQLYVMFLKALFSMAVEDKILPSSPAEKIKAPKRPKPIRETPSLEDFRRIVSAVRSQKFSDTAAESADFIEFLGLAGLGQAEASALCWRDVDFKRGHILTFRKKTRKGFTVPIFPQLQPLLKKRFQIAEQKNNCMAPKPESRVFSIADAKKSLASACQNLGSPNYSSRALRRLFITTAIERGVDVKVIALWQGHVDGGKLILDTYSHVRPVHSQKMAALMA